MFLNELLIPSAYAQSAATKAAEDAPTGLAAMASYIITHFPLWFAGIVIVVITFGLAQWMSGSVREHIVRSRGEEISENALAFIEKVLRVAVLVIGVTIAFAINGLNFTAVVGALSLGVGFAIKDILGNFISSLVMLAQNRIRIGDLIEVGSIKGTIESIDTRVTVIRGIDGRQVVIPNQEMMNSTIVNYMANPTRRLELYTYVSWDSDVEKGINLVRQVLDENTDVLKEPQPLVLLDNIEDSSNYAIRVLFWVDTAKKKWLTIRSNVHYRIIKAFEKAGIDIAYPVQSLAISQDVHNTLTAMKNIKEGLTPDDPQQPTEEQLIEAAKSTANLERIPHLMGKSRPAPAAPQPIQTPASSLKTAENPTPVESLIPPTAMADDTEIL
jgi:small-conductance mechanosensitive channel